MAAISPEGATLNIAAAKAINAGATVMEIVVAETLLHARADADATIERPHTYLDRWQVTEAFRTIAELATHLANLSDMYVDETF